MILSAEPILTPNAPEESHFDASIDRAPGYVVNSLLCAPVVVGGGGGRAIGAIQLCNKVHEKRSQIRVAEEFELSDLKTLCMLCAILGPALSRQLILDREF